MSLRRTKVIDDPLGMFGGVSSSNAEDDEYEDPPKEVVKKVSVVPPLPPTENKPKVQNTVAVNTMPVVHQDVVKKEVAAPPVQVKPVNPPIPEIVSETVITPPKVEEVNRVEITVDTPPKVEEVSRVEITVDVSPEKPAPAEEEPAPIIEAAPKVEEDIFLVRESAIINEAAPPTPTQIPSQTTEDTPKEKKQSDIHSDEDISDLAVASILEREENLDYDMFGRVDVSAKPRAIRTKQTLEEELNFLEELDKLTQLDGNKATTGESVKQSATEESGSSSSSKALVDVDINNMNLDDYISQQLEDSEGGLFD